MTALKWTRGGRTRAGHNICAEIEARIRPAFKGIADVMCSHLAFPLMAQS
jgi:hypothetical protein